MLSKSMAYRVVVDTNVFVSAILSKDGAAREIIRLALQNEVVPVFGNALFNEFCDVLNRDVLFETACIGKEVRYELFHALLSVSVWTRIHFLWRPNFTDEADNHVLELAVASGAQAIITNNLKHFRNGELMFPNIEILTPKDWLKRRPST